MGSGTALSGWHFVHTIKALLKVQIENTDVDCPMMQSKQCKNPTLETDPLNEHNFTKLSQFEITWRWEVIIQTYD